jgi:hypothetical protein
MKAASQLTFKEEAFPALSGGGSLITRVFESGRRMQSKRKRQSRSEASVEGSSVRTQPLCRL